MIVGAIVGFFARSWFMLAAGALLGPALLLGFITLNGGRLNAAEPELTRGELGFAILDSYLTCLVVAASVYGVRLAIRATRRASH